MPSSIRTFDYTATADTKFKLTTQPFLCREANIHILTNDARYGDINITSSYPSITAGNGVSYQDFDLNDIYFMNSAGGSNTHVVATCIQMTPKRAKDLGLI